MHHLTNHLSQSKEHEKASHMTEVWTYLEGHLLCWQRSIRDPDLNPSFLLELCSPYLQTIQHCFKPVTQILGVCYLIEGQLANCLTGFKRHQVLNTAHRDFMAVLLNSLFRSKQSSSLVENLQPILVLVVEIIFHKNLCL